MTSVDWFGLSTGCVAGAGCPVPFHARKETWAALVSFWRFVAHSVGIGFCDIFHLAGAAKADEVECVERLEGSKDRERAAKRTEEEVVAAAQ